MRNLLTYPITSREIIECLEQLAQELSNDLSIGDMRPLLLQTAAAIVNDATVAAYASHAL